MKLVHIKFSDFMNFVTTTYILQIYFSKNKLLSLEYH